MQAGMLAYRLTSGPAYLRTTKLRSGRPKYLYPSMSGQTRNAEQFPHSPGGATSVIRCTRGYRLLVYSQPTAGEENQSFPVQQLTHMVHSISVQNQFVFPLPPV